MSEPSSQDRPSPGSPQRKIVGVVALAGVLLLLAAGIAMRQVNEGAGGVRFVPGETGLEAFEEGLGPLALGMKRAEVEAALGGPGSQSKETGQAFVWSVQGKIPGRIEAFVVEPRGLVRVSLQRDGLGSPPAPTVSADVAEELCQGSYARRGHRDQARGDALPLSEIEELTGGPGRRWRWEYTRGPEGDVSKHWWVWKIEGQLTSEANRYRADALEGKAFYVEADQQGLVGQPNTLSLRALEPR